MSEQIARIVDLKRLRPVKWSDVEKKIKPYRDGYVDTFLAFEGRPLIGDDRQPITDARDRQLCVTAASFAAHAGIPKTTFNLWVYDRRGYTRTGAVTSGQGYTAHNDQPTPGERASRSGIDQQEDHGRCSHCPDWGDE